MSTNGQNGHTSKGRNYASVVPHPTSIRISHHTHFDLVINENIPVYHFDFVPLETSEERLAKGSPLSVFCWAFRINNRNNTNH
ncbi:hypothetical protein CASFOL_018645 [Castilleja foliolosa]|uniref:Uncharacterized protein n=1 Tax=Castilleja foliolosa TaxID=1961234 RepID=A0ABD3D700_9LAMI